MGPYKNPREAGWVKNRGDHWTVNVSVPSGVRRLLLLLEAPLPLPQLSYTYESFWEWRTGFFFNFFLGLGMSACCPFTWITWQNISPIFLPFKFCSIVFDFCIVEKIWEQPDFLTLLFLSGCLNNSFFILEVKLCNVLVFPTPK